MLSTVWRDRVTSYFSTGILKELTLVLVEQDTVQAAVDGIAGIDCDSPQADTSKERILSDFLDIATYSDAGQLPAVKRRIGFRCSQRLQE